MCALVYLITDGIVCVCVDIIISGGENISSIEVENIMLTHPYIKEVAVVAMPNEKWGEVPAAFVALSTAAYITEAALISWCRDKMAHYYAPKKVIFMEDGLPKTSTGKVQKHELRKLLKDTVN
ncbi:hypothetical protein EON63_08630 [archaeon]|nr:MAG: hypothetical protein EON63_08630 [archaeon]